MTFLETRLDIGYDYGTVGGPEYNTTVIVTGGGNEQRNANWSEARRRWQIGDRTYDRSELNYLINFFNACRGSWLGFRFKDWGDYQAKDELIGVGDGVETTFQLKKRYGIAGAFSDRLIKKPVVDSVIVSVGGVIDPSVGVNFATGAIVFTAPPVGNITASFEFDVPVRFEQDRLEHRFEAADADEQLFYVSSLSVIEIRV